MVNVCSNPSCGVTFVEFECVRCNRYVCCECIKSISTNENICPICYEKYRAVYEEYMGHGELKAGEAHATGRELFFALCDQYGFDYGDLPKLFRELEKRIVDDRLDYLFCLI